MSQASVFDFFKSEATYDDVVVRTEAMLKLPLIVANMEATEIREQLVPFLQTKTNPEEPEQEQVLVAMAKHLGSIVPYMDGAQHASLLVPIFEELFGKEESYIRDYAAESCGTVLGLLDTSHLTQVDQYKDMFKRLVPDEDSGDTFYAKVSCVLITPALLKAYGLFDDDAGGKSESGEDNVVLSRKEVRDTFYRMQADENIMVRMTTAKVFLQLVEVVEPEFVTGEVLDALKTLLGDHASAIRECAITYLPAMCQKFHELEMQLLIKNEILPQVKEFAENDSWRIRLALTKGFGKYVSYCDPEVVKDELFPIVVNLMKDTEPEVRQVVIPEIYAYFEAIPISAFNNSMLPVAEVLTEDPIPLVRKLLAELLVEICSKHRDVVAMQVMIEKLLQDEDPGVRLRVINKIEIIARDLPDLATKMTPVLKELFTSPNWRVRQKMVRSVVALVTYLGKDHFVESFLDEYLGMLRDSVDEVRNTASEILPKLVPAVGVDFTFEKVFPSIRTMSNADYLFRLSMLNALSGLLQADLPAGDAFQGECLSLAVSASNDSVPNVRIKACQVLATACTVLEADVIRTVVRPVLDDLQGDKDKDVAHFALQGMALAGA